MADNGLISHLGLGSNVQSILKWLAVILKFPMLKFVFKHKIHACDTSRTHIAVNFPFIRCIPNFVLQPSHMVAQF